GIWTIVGFLLVTVLIGIGFLTRRLVTGEPERSRWRLLVPVVLILMMVAEPSGRDLITQLRDSPMHPRTLATVGANTDRDDLNAAGDWLQDQQATSGEPFRYLGYNGYDLRTMANEDGVVYQNRHFSPKYRRLLIGPRSMFLELYYLQGYNPVQLTNTVLVFKTINGHPLDYHDAHVMPVGMSSPWLDLLTTRYFVVPSAVPPDRPDLLHLSQQYATVYDDGIVRILENPESYSRGWIVHDVDVASQTIALSRVESSSIDPHLTAILEIDATVPALELPQNPDAEFVSVSSYQPDRIELLVHAEASGIAVVGEIFNPQWVAYLDGNRVETLMVDGAIRGVAVGPGDHVLVFRYEPRSIPVGIAVSIGTVLVSLLGLMATGRGGLVLFGAA
ncbi:MAG TPA: hypothetical protein VIY86_01775, partial [Pirellulaceae bacterium]